MTFEGGCYCGQVRYVAEGEPRSQGAMPLPRMSVHQRRRAEHVHADAARQASAM